MNSSSKDAIRLCQRCGTAEPLLAETAIWPAGWECIGCGYRIPERDGLPLLSPDLVGSLSGFDPSWFAHLESVEDTHFWFVARNELIVGLASCYFPYARTLFEIGCGNGSVLRALAGSRDWERLVGSDIHPIGLAAARTRLPDGVELVQMDAAAIPARRVFDLIGAFDVLEHLVDDDAAIRQIAVALRPGGGVILAVPQHPWLWSRQDEAAHHQRRYRRGELETKLSRNGFRVIFSSSFVSLLLPFMILSRASWRRQRKYDPAREFEIGTLANRF